MHHTDPQSIIDYTIVPLGLRIEGQIWTGQATSFTAMCPKCGRIGVISAIHQNKQMVVHTGRANGDKLEGVDYCRLLISASASDDSTNALKSERMES